MAQSKELAIIQHLAKRLVNPSLGVTGHFEDDAFFDPDTRLIFTTDMLVEGTHFRQDYCSPADIGWKAAAVNISDIAAMGGELCYLLVSLGLPEDTPLACVDRLYDGLQACVSAYHGLIVGGDTVRSPQLTLNVTAVGKLPLGHTVGVRSAARPGDLLITTGPHGLSAAGLHWLQSQPVALSTSGSALFPETERIEEEDGHTNVLTKAHLRPRPRVLEGLALSELCSRYALMDTSDGLADALLKIAQGSRNAMSSEQAASARTASQNARPQLVIDEARLPVHPALQAYAEQTGQSALDWMLYGGEDFELLAAVPPDTLIPSVFTLIGEVQAAPDIAPDTASASDAPLALLRRRDESLLPLQPDRTYQHF